MFLEISCWCINCYLCSFMFLIDTDYLNVKIVGSKQFQRWQVIQVNMTSGYFVRCQKEPLVCKLLRLVLVYLLEISNNKNTRHRLLWRSNISHIQLRDGRSSEKTWQWLADASSFHPMALRVSVASSGAKALAFSSFGSCATFSALSLIISTNALINSMLCVLMWTLYFNTYPNYFLR